METSDHLKNGATPKSQMSRNYKIITMKKTFLLFSMLFLCVYANAQDQKFLDFQSAKIAFEKYNDCTEAEKLMKPIYSDFKEDMSFIHLYAKVLKCLNKHKEALTVLQTYNTVAQDPTIDEEIAELNYMIRLNNLDGNWTVSYSNDNNLYNGNYIFKITQYNDKSLSIYCEKWRCNASLQFENEDVNYTYYKGSYNEVFSYTYTSQTFLEALNGTSHQEDGNATGYWNNISFKYDKKNKILSYNIPKAKANSNGDVVETYGTWNVELKRK